MGWQSGHGRSLSGAFLVVVAAACGGSVGDDKTAPNGGAGTSAGPDAGGGAGGSAGTTGGATGSAGAAGRGGSTGSGSGGSAGATECRQGGACVGEDTTCEEASCCPCTYRCRNGQWTAAACPRCLPPVCPRSAPQAGAPCNPCNDQPGEACLYDSCPAGSRARATCVNGAWTITVERCPNNPCGDKPGAVACPAGEICVMQGGWVPSYSCAKDPCAPNPLTCECAGSLCSVGSCAMAAEGLVACVCLVC